MCLCLRNRTLHPIPLHLELWRIATCGGRHSRGQGFWNSWGGDYGDETKCCPKNHRSFFVFSAKCAKDMLIIAFFWGALQFDRRCIILFWPKYTLNFVSQPGRYVGCGISLSTLLGPWNTARLWRWPWPLVSRDREGVEGVQSQVLPIGKCARPIGMWWWKGHPGHQTGLQRRKKLK